jgi:hypothetical protein
MDLVIKCDFRWQRQYSVRRLGTLALPGLLAITCLSTSIVGIEYCVSRLKMLQ